MNINNVNELFDRGFIKDFTSDNNTLIDLLKGPPITFYMGIDPTADSLHVGHLVGLQLCKKLKQLGHKPIILLGSSTATIGDPTGKDKQRVQLDKEVVQDNCEYITHQVKRFFNDEMLHITSNRHFNYTTTSFLDWLSMFGSHFKVNKMIKADSIKNRLDSSKSLSYLEFSYMLLQAYDFYHLSKCCNCTLQIGGSDQWSNILAGIDLIKSIDNKQVYGLTFPLLTNSKGEKMGKTANNPIWLDLHKTSVLDFYSYWINIDDKDLEKCYLLFSDYPVTTIKNAIQSDIVTAKQSFALEITELVHDRWRALEAEKQAKELHNNNFSSTQINVNISTNTLYLPTILKECLIVKSNNEARKLISNKGIKLNNVLVTDSEYTLKDEDILGGYILITSGKTKQYKIKLNIYKTSY
jgi:tyrosyl-tRNA synthetase